MQRPRLLRLHSFGWNDYGSGLLTRSDPGKLNPGRNKTSHYTREDDQPRHPFSRLPTPKSLRAKTGQRSLDCRGESISLIEQIDQAPGATDEFENDVHVPWPTLRRFED